MLGLGNNLARGGVLGFSNNYSLEFDGSNDYVDCGASDNLVTGNNVTISAWVKNTGTVIGYVFQSQKGVDSTNITLMINENASGATAAGWVGGLVWSGSAHGFTAADGSIDDSAWHHLVYTTTASAQVVYLDGISVATSTHTFANAASSTDSTIIGNNGGNTLEVTGNIDEVAIWNTALSAGSISNIYNNRVPTDLLADSNSANLQGWWRMGDGVLDVKTKFGLVADQVNPTLGADIAVNGDLSSNPFAHATDYSGGWSDTSIGSSEATWSSGNQTISCVGDDSGSNRGNATARVTAVSGQVYKVTFTNSTTPVNAALRVSNVNAWSSGDYLNVSPTSFQEFHFTSGVSGYVYITFSVYDANTWTFGNLKVVPVNGNAGKLISFDGSDFKTDTP